MTEISIGQAIRVTRARKGLTLQQLGETLNVSRASLSKIELSDSITYKKLCEVADALGVKASEIVSLTEAPSEAIDILRDVVECGYLQDRAFDKDADGGPSLFEEICSILGENPSEYKEKINGQQD